MSRRTRKIKLKDYGILPYRYRELQYFCLQYPDWKKELRYGYNAVEHPNTGYTSSGSSKSRVESEALRNVTLREKIEIVEQAAVEADAVAAAYILKSVTEEISYEQLGNVPLGRTDFYVARKNFFVILHRKKTF